MEYIINNTQSINELLKTIEPNSTIILNDGIYNEKIELNVNYITIKALNKHKAILSNNDYYHKIMPNNNECNTFGTYTLFVGSNNVTLQDIIIENTATPSYIYGQAVALHVIGTHFLCDNCIIRSAQDTLFTGPLPKDLSIRYKGFYPEDKLKQAPSIQHYKNCQIIGDVDFIFGCATTLFEECEIITIPRKDNGICYVSAPAHAVDCPYGYLFYKCTLKGSVENSTYLARPWRDYGKAAFINCVLDKHIKPEGFNKWDNTNRDKTAEFIEYTPNHDLNNREKWVSIIDENKAINYVCEFIKYMKNN